MPTRKELHEQNVSKLDNIGSSKEAFEFVHQVPVIERVIGDFIERVHTNINNTKDLIVTGKIADITMKAEGDQVNVYAYPHLLYIDRGVNGSVVKRYDTPHSYKDKMPPVQVFKDWIKAKGINYRNNEKYSHEKHPFVSVANDEKQLNNAAWAMANKVFKEGIKPRKVYSKELPKLVDDLKNELAGFCIQQVVQQIDIAPRSGGKNRIVISM